MNRKPIDLIAILREQEKIMRTDRQENPLISETKISNSEPAKNVQTNKTAELEVDSSIVSWIKGFKEGEENKPSPANDQSPRSFLYILEIIGNQIYLNFISSKLKKSGGYAKTGQIHLSLTKFWDSFGNEVRPTLTEEDWKIIYSLGKKIGTAHSSFHGSCLNFEGSIELLQEMISTKRCFMKYEYDHCLSWGNPQAGRFEWDLIDDREVQKLNLVLENKQSLLLKSLSHFCYYNKRDRTFGLVNFDEPQHVVKHLLQAPVIPNDQVNNVRQLLTRDRSTLAKFSPKEIREIIVSGDGQPILTLYLNNFFLEEDYLDNYWENSDEEDSYEAIVANLSFKYEDYTVPCNIEDLSTNGTSFSTKNKEGEIVRILRNRDQEELAIQKILSEAKWDFCQDDCVDNLSFDFINNDFSSVENDIIQQAIEIIKHDVPYFQKLGFQVVFDTSFPINKVSQANEWFLDTGEEDVNWANDWFDVKIGVMIDGEQVNLLPALEKIIRDSESRGGLPTSKNIPDDETINLVTAEGNLIQISAARLIKFAEHLMLDFSNGHQDGKSLRISKWNTAFLSEFVQDEAAAQSRWIGSDSLKKFATKITDNSFQGQISPPKSLQCELRPYQLEGLKWLQFLRISGLNGILADDMGLGKTVQTLAHLLIEKEEERAVFPTLVVAPTSLMPNWFNEASRLAPSLKVLVLHGNERKQFFSKLSDYDLILTTYPLLMRDKEFLLSHQFHFIILDEAQVVKNFKTQAYQVIQQIRSNHRLCLSGTPMENHLGELWSLFHLLLPGFLGDQKTFQTIYRKPIEKQGNQARRESLAERIKPFILRRTKQQVALELPEKTEIIQKIELKSGQRDLYEAIRMRAQNRVMKEIQKKGLKGSQIIVLDALLKLRQVCCDPRLVKMEDKKTVEDSAKLECLMEMLTQMIEEKRKILIFSQFTSMLALIAEALEKIKVSYTILTGDTKDRNIPVLDFQNTSIPIMLISLKAGGVGLNLTAADTVIHYDPWWNPAVEAQATDRAHRIGQKNAVFVYKLVVSGSLEEKIIELQDRKRGLISSLLDANANIGSNLSMEDLESIFKPLPPAL